MINCPNINHPLYKSLVEVHGPALTNYLFHLNGDRLPTLEESHELLSPKPGLSNALPFETVKERVIKGFGRHGQLVPKRIGDIKLNGEYTTASGKMSRQIAQQMQKWVDGIPDFKSARVEYSAVHNALRIVPNFQLSSEQGMPDLALSKQLSHFVSALKGEIRNVGEIVIDGVKYDANAVTDILNRVISVVDGKEKLDTLPEETGHLFVEYLPQSSALLKEMMKDIVTRPIFDKTLNEYKDNKFYQNEDGSVNEDKIAREAAGKMIAQAITDKWKNQREKSVWQKLWSRLWNWIKKLAGKVKETPYEQAAGDILKGKTGKLDLAKIAEAEKEGRYYFQMSKEQQENEDYIQQVRDNPNTTDEQRTRIDQIILDPKNKIVLDPDTHEYTDLNINNPTKYTPGTKAIGGTKFLTDKLTGEPAYEMNRKWGNYFDGILRGVLLNKGIDEVESPIVYENNSQLQADFDSKFKQKAFDIARNIYQNEVADGSIVLSQSILSYKAPRAIDSIASSSDILVVSPSGKVSNIDLKTSWKSINAVNGHGNKIYEVEHKIERDMKNPENNSWLLRLPGGGYDTGLRLSKKDTHILQLMLHQELLRKMGVKNFGNFRNYYIHLITDDNTNAVNPTLIDAVAEGFSQNQLEDLPRVYEDLMERLLPEEQSSDPLSAADPQPAENLNPNPDELAKPLLKIIENLEKRKDSLLRGVKPETANELKQTLSEVKILEDKYKVEALMRFVKYAQEFTNKGLTLTGLDYNKLTGENRRNYFKWLIEARDIAKANLDLIPESIEVMQGANKMQVPMLSLLNNEQRGTFNKLRADMNSLRIQSDLAMVNYVVQTGVNEFDITPAPGQSAAKAAEEFLFKATQDISLFMKETDAPGEMRDTLLGKINNIIRKADISVSMEAEKIRNNIEQMAKDFGLDLSKKENSDFMFDLDKDGKRTRLKQKTSLDFLEEKRAMDESIMNPDGTRKEFVENPQDQKDKDYNIQLAKDKEKYRDFYDPEMRINAGDQREGTHYHLTQEYKDAREKVMRYLPDFDTWVKKTSVSQEEYEAFRNHYQVRNLDFLTPDRDQHGDYTGTVSRNNSWSVNRQYVEVNDNKYSYRENPNAPSGWEQVIEKSLENPEYKKLMATDTKQRKLFVAYKGMLEKAIAEGGPELEEWYARGGLVALTGKMFDKGMKTGAMKLLKESVSIGTIPQISDRETTETGQLRHTLHVPFISKLKNAQRIKAIEHSLTTLEDDFNRGELRDDSGKRITGQVEKNTYKKSLEDKLKIENHRTDASDLEVDPLRGLTAFLEGVNTYKHMADIEGQLLAMQQLVNQEISLDPTDKRTVRQYYGDEREFQRRGMDTAFKEKNDIRSIEVLNNIIKNFYGEGVEKKVIDSIAKKFMTWTSASAMGLNIPNNLNNFILYSFNSMRQGVAGRFMSFKNMRKGFAEVEKNYFTGIAKKAFMRKGENNLGYKDKAESKVEAMMKRFNINAEDYFKMQGADAWISKFYIGEKLAVQHAEFGMATGYMMDQLLRDKDGNEIKITKDGKETPVSMWDAYKYNNNTGELELIDQLKGREAEYEREEKNIVIRAKDIQIKTQGNYDARSKTLMDNHLLGRLLMQFHRFWKPAWNDRFAKQYTHASLGEMEGTWTSMYSAIKMMKEFDDHWTTQLQGGWKGFAERAKAAGYSDERIDLMKKNLITDLVEVLTVSSLFAMSYVIGKAAISYHKKHPDMDKNTIRFINYWRYTTSRLASEQMTFTPGVNLILLTELVNNPLAVSRTLKNFGQAIRLSVQYPINEALGDHKANYYQKGIYRGDSKAYIRLRKSIPFWQVYDKWLLFSEMSDYNNVLAGATGGKAAD